MPVMEPKFNVLLPATVIVATLEKPEDAVSRLARFVDEALFVVMFKLLNSAFVSTKVNPPDPMFDKVKFRPAVVEGAVRLFVRVTVAPPANVTLLTVKFCKALAVIVAVPAAVLPAVAFKLSPLNVTLVIVPAAVVLDPFTSVIVTVPVRIPPVADVNVGVPPPPVEAVTVGKACPAPALFWEESTVAPAELGVPTVYELPELITAVVFKVKPGIVAPAATAATC